MENPQSLADTHLNMCAVLSQLSKHKEALQHVLLSITLLQDEFLNLGPPEKNIDYNEKKDEENPKVNIEDRVSVLAIAYHNLGVELEYLKRVKILKKIFLGFLILFFFFYKLVSRSNSNIFKSG